MSSLADTWFVPDHEYYASRADYAVVRASAAEIRHMNSVKDMALPHKSSVDTTFRDELSYLKYNPCYPYAESGKLLYADVDEENPEHKEQVFDVWAKEEPLEKESEKSKASRKALADHLASNLGSEDLAENPSEHGATVEEGVEGSTGDYLEDGVFFKGNLEDGVFYRGDVDVEVTDYILSATSQEEKEVLLSIASSQSQRKTQRPVLVLVGMAEDRRNTEFGVTKGWVAGYDFVKNLLIIKPFISKKDHHLFGEKWYDPVVEDGISFSGSPNDFIAQYIELGEAAHDKTVEEGFKMLMHTIAARWIIRQWPGLSKSDPETFTDELKGKAKKAVASLKAAMGEITFPFEEKVAKIDDINFGPFRWMSEVLDIQEDGFRCSVKQAKKDGREKMAENVVKLLGKMMDELKAFNENPEGDF